jgi:hypothetical protein
VRSIRTGERHVAAATPSVEAVSSVPTRAWRASGSKIILRMFASSGWGVFAENGMLGSKNFLFVFVLATSVCSCAARHDIQPAFASNNSGIHGRLVTTRYEGGKVEVAGPASGRVKITTADQTQEVATIDTDSGGDFEVGLRPGKYFVYTEPFEGMFYGRRVAVEPRQMTYLELRLPPR